MSFIFQMVVHQQIENHDKANEIRWFSTEQNRVAPNGSLGSLGSLNLILGSGDNSGYVVTYRVWLLSYKVFRVYRKIDPTTQ